MTNRRPSLFWPIIFIGVGAILLLTNLGVITGNPWSIIWRFWPVLLIVIGLDILFGHRTATGSIVSAVLALLLVGGVLWILIAKPSLPGIDLNLSGNLQTKQISSPLNDVTAANVSIGFTTGSNRLYALSDSSNLIEGDIRYYGTLNFSASGSGSQSNVQLSSSSVPFVFPFGEDSQEHWDIGLNPQVTYNLDLNMGVGQSTIDLSKLKLSGGKVDIGVGQVDLQLPASGSFTFSINGGVGQLRLHVPGNIGLQVDLNAGLGSFNSGSRLHSRGGNLYETDNFSSADSQITLRINGGVGSIDVIDGE
jgi:hypothetical protein